MIYFVIGFLLATLLFKPVDLLTFRTEQEATEYVDDKTWMFWRRYTIKYVNNEWIVGYVTPATIMLYGLFGR